MAADTSVDRYAIIDTYQTYRASVQELLAGPHAAHIESIRLDLEALGQGLVTTSDVLAVLVLAGGIVLLKGGAR